ncbi:MAG TPA: DUF6192 family protein [Pseudonocardiaceae bacterium]|nr:DUF6192 family protein [Pseudonocardiaceae bacterium]
MEPSARSEILGLLYATTRFSTKAALLAPTLAGIPLSGDDRALLLDRVRRVRAAAEWAEHAVSTGDTTMPPEVAAVFSHRHRRARPGSTP